MRFACEALRVPFQHGLAGGPNSKRFAFPARGCLGFRVWLVPPNQPRPRPRAPSGGGSRTPPSPPPLSPLPAPRSAPPFAPASPSARGRPRWSRWALVSSSCRAEWALCEPPPPSSAARSGPTLLGLQSWPKEQGLLGG
eukprot:9501474-Pyramimonas_sp.AAC.2